MKRINNLSVYNLLGYLLFGIAAYAFVNANNTDLYAKQYPLGQATAPIAPIAPEPTQSNTNRHTITLVLNELSDLKVTEGQRINEGDIIIGV